MKLHVFVAMIVCLAIALLPSIGSKISILAKCATGRESPSLARRLHDSTARQALHLAGE